ncbi:MAG TPA: hypothetical protein VFD04_05415 [Actinomycetes bacterium]|nr:hypothetical protein [Actinomycetes bacterium]
MAVSQSNASPQRLDIPPEAPAPPAVFASELLLGVPLLAVGLLAWAALALAHLGRFGLAAAVAAAAAALAALAVLARVAGGRVRVAVDPGGLAMVAGVGLVAGLLCFPGFPYGAGDKDPGSYTSHAIAIARTGSYQLADPVPSRVPAVVRWSPGARFPAVWAKQGDPSRVVPQFYHLWPALLAVAYAAGGTGWLVQVGPACGVLAVLAAALAARRAFGLLTGTLAGLLLAANMLEVWQAKYPTTEILTQALVSGAVLGAVVALRSGWRPAAGLAGLLLGLSYLARPDSLALLLLAAAGLAALLAAGRFDGRAGWFAAGLAVTLPHGLLQAYHFASKYTASNDVPGLGTVALAGGGVLVAGALLRLTVPGAGAWLADRLGRRRVQGWAGLAVVAAAGLLMVVGFLRPWLFGRAYFTLNGRRLLSYDEQSLHRLSWFFTLPGFALMGAGLAVVALRRWRPAAWAVVLPALCLLPLYAWHAQNSTRLMWWSRRFVPVVVPGLAVLIAVALAAGLRWPAGWRLPARAAGTAARRRWPDLVAAAARRPWPLRAASGVATAFLLVVFLGQSLPLRGHHELAGSFAVTRQVAAVAGDRQGVFLWQPPQRPYSPVALFGAPVWLQRGEVSALLPGRTDPGYVRAFVRGFPGQPVFLVWSGEPPPAYAALGLQRVAAVDTSLPRWQESDTSRPRRSVPVPVRFAVWRVRGT